MVHSTVDGPSAARISVQGIGQLFDVVLSLCDVHERHTRDFANASPESPITGGDNVAAVRGDAVNDAVVSISACVTARKPLKRRVSGHSVDAPANQQ